MVFAQTQPKFTIQIACVLQLLQQNFHERFFENDGLQMFNNQ